LLSASPTPRPVCEPRLNAILILSISIYPQAFQALNALNYVRQTYLPAVFTAVVLLCCSVPGVSSPQSTVFLS
ncbi:hypothetical protein B0H19DRAFT_1136852, partial [Mycena capillaripes]